MRIEIEAALQPRTKPDGGFVGIKVWLLAAAWWSYRTKRLSLRGLRVLFALHEMQARRCTIARDRNPTFGLEELHGLTGGGGGMHLRKELKKLEALGLVKPKRGQIAWPKSVEDLTLPIDEFMRWYGTHFTNRARTVPMPRRLLRFLAGAGTRALTATVLAHSMRMLYMRNKLIEPRGRCKLSWVANAFDVNISSAERARARMLELRLIVRDSDDSSKERWSRRKWGGCFHWNLTWARTVSETQTSDGKRKRETSAVTCLRGETPLSTTRLRGVESDKQPLRESNNQKPENGPTGVASKTQFSKGPSLRHIEREDLTDTARLLRLYELATEAKLVGRAEADELKFVGLAEHALAYGTKNQGGLFAKLLGLWGGGAKWDITHDDEDRAQERIRSHRERVTVRRRPQKPKRDIHGEEILSIPKAFKDVPRDAWVAGLITKSLKQPEQSA